MQVTVTESGAVVIVLDTLVKAHIIHDALLDAALCSANEADELLDYRTFCRLYADIIVNAIVKK